MTLIAFATGKNRADILADTSAYTHGGRDLFKSSKVYPLPHLDMAYATQGDCVFAAAWRFQTDQMGRAVPTFDDFVFEAGPLLRAVWTDVSGRPNIEASAVFLIGYSQEAGRFTAYQFDSDSDFERVEIDEPYCIPTAFDTRLAGMELARLQGRFDDGKHPGMLAAIEEWQEKPALVAPTTPKGWVALGKHVRASRAMVPNSTGMKVFVAGDLFHTVVRRGEFKTSRVHTFDDEGPEFVQIVAGTLHPLSQFGLCRCDSGRPYVDCCLAPYAAKPCSCGSGELFADCCSVKAETSDSAAQGIPA